MGFIERSQANRFKFFKLNLKQEELRSQDELTEETPSQHWIAIRNDTVHRAMADIKIVRMRNLELGKTILKLGGASIPVFDRERTLVDSFRYLSRETALRALKAALSKKGMIL